MKQAISNNIDTLIAWDYPGIIGVESATAYWGLSTYADENCIILVEDKTAEKTGVIVESSLPFFYVPDVNKNNVVYLSKHLRVTDREQTVCDMVRYNRHEFHLFETLISAYNDGEVDVKRMENIAEQYGILEKMRSLYRKALDVEDE